MIKPILLFCAILIGFYNLQAQSEERAIIASAGEQLSNSSCQVSFTVGDLIIETSSNENIELTQGFQQGNVISTTVNLNNSDKLSLKVYPNPYIDFISIDIDGDFEPLNYRIYRLDGALILNDQLEMGKNKILLNSIDYPQIILTITNKKGEVLKAFKLNSK